LLEEVRELEEVDRRPREAGDLRHDESLDQALLSISAHPGALRMTRNVFAIDSVEPVHSRDVPTLCLGVRTATELMMLRTLALDLVVGADPDPETNLRCRSCHRGAPRA